MKNHRLILLLLGLTSGALIAADQKASPLSPYEQAVQSYVDAATDQLRTIRAEVDAELGTAPTEETKKRFEPAYAKLDQTDRVLAALKKAGPADFDRIKLRFEHTRADAVKAIEAARKG